MTTAGPFIGLRALHHHDQSHLLQQIRSSRRHVLCTTVPSNSRLILLRSAGPKVLHQVPSDSIVPSPNSTTAPLFSFPSISSYIIPRQEFCDRLLTICISRYRVLGYPVCITHHKYDRNEFIFNFCIVLEDSGSSGRSGNEHDDPVDVNSYLSVVRKLARLMRGLEEQDEFLSKDVAAPGTGKVYALCEMILEDLNNYCECMIPIGTTPYYHHQCFIPKTLTNDKDQIPPTR